MRLAVALFVLVALALPVPGDQRVVHAQSSPVPGFVDTVVITGLTRPTAVAFAADGRVFVAEKRGLIKVFDSLSDTTPTTFADIRTQVYNYVDRGLLGMALDPQFPVRPYVYVLYTRDADIGGTAPKWNDVCPTPPGGTADGCTASARLSRLPMSAAGTWTGTEQVLIDGWFQQYPSHSIGSIAFGADGALYASGGDAASWQFADYGQEGNPANPGGDPPVPVGGTQTPPTAEGGALRAQDLRTAGDPVGLNGSVIRIDPDSAAGLPDNPLSFHADANARRIVAYGLRNPFRIAVRPGTRELWVGDVGWHEYEEVNVVPDPAALAAPRNFGWPCYDGTSRTPEFDRLNLNICENLYAESGATTFARFQYREGTPIRAGEMCGSTDASLSGLAFYGGGAYPAQYDGALFLADYTRGCIWAMFPGPGGVPDPATIQALIVNAALPVDLETGPGGDLFYVEIGINAGEGAIHRIQYNAGNTRPDAVASATPTSGAAPLTVSFDGRGSTDPEGGTLAYSWDLDGNGTFGDAAGATPTFTYASNGTYVASLRVTDPGGLQDTASVTIVVGNSAPVPVIDTPAASLRWRVGQTISFSGHATDAEDGTLGASRLRWSAIINHCSSATSCHQHFLQEFDGAAGGSFTALDHDYPSYLTLQLTATDSGGVSRTVSRRLDPQTVALTFESAPAGLQLAVANETFAVPSTRTFIAGSAVSMSAPSPQTLGGTTYTFQSWSDGLPATHSVTAGTTAATYRATFAAGGAATLPAPWTARDIGSTGRTGSTVHSGGTFTVRGAGADVWGRADAFQYAYRPLAGDGTIVARVADVAGSAAWTKVGVMIRGSTAADAPHAFMLVSTAKGLAFQRRTTTGALSTHTSGGTGTAPRWVRLVRTGNRVTAAVSSNGAAWTTVGQDTIDLPATALVGLAVSSHTTTALATGTFDNVLVTQLPAGWEGRDIGSVGRVGAATASGGTFTVTGNGADIWGRADAFHFVSRTLTGDGEIVARVATVSGSSSWTKAGVMIRQSLAANAPHAHMLVSTGNGLALQWRATAGGISRHTAGGGGTAPRWVRLRRSGNVFTGAVSTDGAAWTTVGTATIVMSGPVHVGLAVTSHATSATATATFDGVSVEP